MDDEDEIKKQDDEFNEQMEFWSRVGKSEGFDVEHLMDIKPHSCLLFLIKDDFPTEVVLYARIGIHRYNMIHETNLQLSCIEKCNTQPSVMCYAYYITLVAKDPSAGGSLVTFQTQVNDEGFDIKKLTCPIARPKFAPPENPIGPLPRGPVDGSYQVKLPDEWPSKNAFNDKKRYYVVKKSELRKHDWIRLYMELAFLNANTKLKNPNLSKLVIVKVALETKENVELASERLKATNAIFYIKYKYHPNKGHEPPCDRIAIVKRSMDKNTGLLRLAFDCRFAKTFLQGSD